MSGAYLFFKSLFLSLSLPGWAAKLREACFDPGNMMNGTRMGTDYKLGSMVTFHCEAGYLLQGYSTLTCVMGNSKRPEWDRAKPSCQGEKQQPSSREPTLQLLGQYLIQCDTGVCVV